MRPVTTALVLRIASLMDACDRLSETLTETANAMPATIKAHTATMPTRRLGRQPAAPPRRFLMSAGRYWSVVRADNRTIVRRWLVPLVAGGESFAGTDGQRESALEWRERAIPFWVVRARRVVGRVEVEQQLASLPVATRVAALDRVEQIAAGAVGFRSARAVAERHEQAAGVALHPEHRQRRARERTAEVCSADEPKRELGRHAGWQLHLGKHARNCGR